jgi:hypothetical protein
MLVRPDQSIHTEANQATVFGVSSFSPFVLSIPEPSTACLRRLRRDQWGEAPHLITAFRHLHHRIPSGSAVGPRATGSAGRPRGRRASVWAESRLG